MILIPNVTCCPACNRLVYAIDDLFDAVNWSGTEEIPGYKQGIYHYACFRSAPFRDAYMKIDAAAKNRTLDAEGLLFVVLARTPDFALTLRPAIETYVLYFLPWGRQLEFPKVAAWKEFLTVIAGPDGPQPTPTNARGGVRLRREPAGWELATRQLVPMYADFLATDLARLREHLTARSIDPSRTPFELGKLCSQLGIIAREVDCPLERLTGTFTWPKPGEPDEPIVLMVQVEAWNTVVLTTAELEGLRRFLLGLGKK